jgi:hypothetical protein
MKRIIIPFFGLALLFLASCGDSVIEDTCMVCHSDDYKAQVEFQFNQSAHRVGAIAVDYAGGRASCAACHSHEGFVEFAANGSVDGDITMPTAWQCKTCHNIHKTFEEDDYAFRLAEPIAFIYDETVVADMGNSNLCANCHQSRRAEPNADVPGATFEITSTHYGPHHGAQANVLYGAGFAEIAGPASYPAMGSGNHVEVGCTGCHMADYGDGMGGHTFNPQVAACNSCHGATDEDFNYGGVADDVALMLEELRDLLVDKGILEYVEADEAYEPIVGVHPMAGAQAFFNWVGLEEDRSLGAHNPKYVEALLENSIAAVEAL